MEETENRNFVESFTVLAAAAAVTDKAVLGTAAAIPIRWPLKLAQNFASLSYLAGGRVIAGLGLGGNPKEFESTGLSVDDRVPIFEETIQILRMAWGPGPVQFEGQHFRVDGIDVNPKPVEHIPVFYAGGTPAGVRRAAEHADGWMAGRIPLATFAKRLELLRAHVDEEKPRMPIQIEPLVVISERRQDAARRVSLPDLAISSEGSKFWVKPASGEFRTMKDLEGLILCGTPSDIVEQIGPYAERGVDEFVFDLRLQFDDYENALELIGRDVLPRLS